MKTTIPVPPGALAQYLADEDLKDTELILQDGDHPLPLDPKGTRVTIKGGPGARLVDPPDELLSGGARVTIEGTSRLRFEGVTIATDKVVFINAGDKVEFVNTEIEEQANIVVGHGGSLHLRGIMSHALVFKVRNGGTVLLAGSSLDHLRVDYGTVFYSGVNAVMQMVAQGASFLPAGTGSAPDLINGRYYAVRDGSIRWTEHDTA